MFLEAGFEHGIDVEQQVKDQLKDALQKGNYIEIPHYGNGTEFDPLPVVFDPDDELKTIEISPDDQCEY